MTPKVITLAVTGASGALYTLRLFECLLRRNIKVQFITSQPGQIVLGMETELKLSGPPQKMRQALADYFQADAKLIQVYSRDQWTAPPASPTVQFVRGSHRVNTVHHQTRGDRTLAAARLPFGSQNPQRDPAGSFNMLIR